MQPKIALAAVLAVAACSSARAQAPLKPAKIIPDSPDVVEGRWAGIEGLSSVAVWDLKELRQVSLTEIPGLERRDGEKDYAWSSLRVVALSRDGKSALVAVNTQFRKDRDDPFGVRTGNAAAYLVADGQAKRIFELPAGKCDAYGGITTKCPSVFDGAFSPDAKSFLLWYTTDTEAVITKISKRAEYGWTYVDSRMRFNVILADASGKVLERRSYEGRFAAEHAQDGWRYSPAKFGAGFLPDGRAVLLADDQAGCVVKEFSGKQVSFLEDCSSTREPRFIGGVVRSTKGPFAAWNAQTGALAASLPGALHESGRSVSSDDASAGVEVSQAQGSTYVAKITEANGTTQTVTLEMPAPKYAIYGVSYARTVGRLLVYGQPEGQGYLSAVYDLSAAAPVSAAPAAPAAAPGVNVDLPPASTVKQDPDAYAVVIGIEKYRQSGIPSVDFAARDARTMHAYLTGAMGFDPKNAVLLTDERASKTDLEKHLGTWLKNRVGPKSRVFIFYAGHGAPNPTTGAGYLMPYEADPSYLDDTAYPLAKLYASLDALPTKDVTVVLDACFSGQGPRSLLAKGARPLVVASEQKGPARAAVIAAAASNQISLSDPEARHGLLTNYLLEGLHGGADADGDGSITSAEAFAYAKPKVERAARLQNQEQTPTGSAGLGAQSRAWITLKK